MSESIPWLALDARKARKKGADAIAHRQRTRLAEIVTFARDHSPLYRELYQDLPDRVTNPALLPVTSKKDLMPRFDDWVTDREVRSEEVQAFVENPDLIGERFLDKYTVATTSGTTGTRGIFLLDDRSMSVTNALILRVLSAWLGVGDAFRILVDGMRLAMVNAMGGHFSSAVAATRLQRRHPNRVRTFPVDMSLPAMVAELNQFQPSIIASYASMAVQLATEQQAGRLQVKPVLVVLSAEGLASHEYDRIAKVFNAKVRDSYAATECPFLSYRCEEGWLHVNSDWLFLEPVEADYQPTPPGKQSHTVLLTNLANRVQPILRYDLGDSILQRPDPCPCGNPLPAIHVQGRSADILSFASDGGEVTIAPLLFLTLMDHIRGIDLIQIVQTTPTTLRVRLRLAASVDADRVWESVLGELTQLLIKHNLEHVTVERASEPPQQSSSGKYREVIPYQRETEVDRGS